MSFAQARAAADGAVERTRVRAAAAAQPARRVVPDGAPHAWQDGDAAIAVAAVDESAKIDLNPRQRGAAEGAAAERRRRWMPKRPQRLVDAIARLAGRRRPDAARTGPRTPTTAPPGSSTGPPTRRSKRSANCSACSGMTPALFAKIADSLTVIFAAGRHQPGDGVARRAAGAAERDARSGRRVPRAAQGRAREQAARAAVCRRPGLRRRRDCGVADTGRGDDARWCNLRARSGRASVGDPRRP